MNRRAGGHRLAWPIEALHRVADRTGDGFTITNISNERARVDILEPIGGWFGVDAGTFIRELRNLDASEIELHINSPGGDVFDGVAIYEALLSHPAKITTYVDGLAASAASYIAQAGETVIVAPQAMLMIHNAHGYVYGGAEDMYSMGDLLGKINTVLADLYAERCGGEPTSWREAMKAETWYTADEAVEAGLATRKREPTLREQEQVTADNRLTRADRVAAARAFVERAFSNNGLITLPAVSGAAPVQAPSVVDGSSDSPAPVDVPAGDPQPTPMEGSPADEPAPDVVPDAPDLAPDQVEQDAVNDLVEQLRSALRF
jgi:ATP-dependent protease ClpP protease subunit